MILIEKESKINKLGSKIDKIKLKIKHNYLLNNFD